MMTIVVVVVMNNGSDGEENKPVSDGDFGIF